MAHHPVRHQNASQGPYLTMCFGTLMAHCGWMRHQYTWHTNGALFGDAPLVYFGILMAHSVVMRHQYEYQVLFFYFSDFCTGYKIYYLTEYRQQHTATADSSNTIEDQSPNTIHHISLRIQKTEQRQNTTSLETASSEFVFTLQVDIDHLNYHHIEESYGESATIPRWFW